MHDVRKWFAPEDFLALMANKRDRTIKFTETIVYKDGRQIKVFSKDFPGVIAKSPRGRLGDSIEKIAEFNGLTIAESMEQNKSSHNLHDYIWHQFAKWFTENQKL